MGSKCHGCPPGFHSTWCGDGQERDRPVAAQLNLPEHGADHPQPGPGRRVRGRAARLLGRRDRRRDTAQAGPCGSVARAADAASAVPQRQQPADCNGGAVRVWCRRRRCAMAGLPRNRAVRQRHAPPSRQSRLLGSLRVPGQPPSCRSGGCRSGPRTVPISIRLHTYVLFDQRNCGRQRHRGEAIHHEPGREHNPGRLLADVGRPGTPGNRTGGWCSAGRGAARWRSGLEQYTGRVELPGSRRTGLRPAGRARWTCSPGGSAGCSRRPRRGYPDSASQQAADSEFYHHLRQC